MVQPDSSRKSTLGQQSQLRDNELVDLTAELADVLMAPVPGKGKHHSLRVELDAFSTEQHSSSAKSEG